MPQFKKAILKVGRYVSPDGTVEVTPARLRHWAQTFRIMRSRNLMVPVGFDHKDEPAQQLPVAFSSDRGKALSAVNAVGQMTSFELAKDGKAATITLDLPDKTAAEKAEQNVVEVSPVIHPRWRDGRGNGYRDIIGRMDLVVHPVDNSQTPFEPIQAKAIACSLRMSLGETGASKVYRMADDPEKTEEMESDDMATETTDDNPDFPSQDTAKENDRLPAIIAHLETLGVSLPADTTDETFQDRLLTALKTVEAMKAQQESENAADDDNEDEEEPMTVADPQFAAMSLQARAAHAYASRQYQGDLGRRIESLVASGRCSPAEAKTKRTGLASVKLSLNSQGEQVKTELEKWIEDRETLPVGAVWEPGQRLRMSTQVAEPSREMVNGHGDLTDEEAEAAVDRIFGKKQGVR